MPTTWDPTQYLRYQEQRERPFWDLLAHVGTPSPRHVVDLGCGPGTATVGLLERWPDATVTGVDSSPTMIERASAVAVPGRLGFELADIRTWEPPGPLDVVLSNATLQWVPGHTELFGTWIGWLAPGGVLAFQVPGNFDERSHTLLRDLAASPPWRDRLPAVTRPLSPPDPAVYHRILTDLGATADIWETTYQQVLTGPDPILEWVRGTALRPYLDALDDAATVDFTDSYAAALRDAYPPEPTGETLFPFRRVFVVATLP